MGDTHLSGVAIAGAPVVAGDFALSGGFGSTASVAVAPGSTDRKGRITVTSAGSGQGANPTVTLTPKEALDVAAVPFVARGDETGDDQLSVPATAKITAGTLVLKFVGTPVAAEAFTFDYVVL
ncbi:MAG: hypothetical protein WD556_11365 [Actinomycetota bacterium]